MADGPTELDTVGTHSLKLLARPHGPGAYLSLPGHLAPPVIGVVGLDIPGRPLDTGHWAGGRHSPFNLM